MCIMSMVSDHYGDKFPGGLGGWVPGDGMPSKPFNLTGVDLGELKALIEEFRTMMDAAKKLDIALKQPDCVDPEKAKLQERINRLEKIVDALIASGEKN